MTTYNQGPNNPAFKDGRQSDGFRLGWIPRELHDRIKAQAEAQGITVSDFVIAALEMALLKDKENMNNVRKIR